MQSSCDYIQYSCPSFILNNTGARFRTFFFSVKDYYFLEFNFKKGKRNIPYFWLLKVVLWFFKPGLWLPGLPQMIRNLVILTFLVIDNKTTKDIQERAVERRNT